MKKASTKAAGTDSPAGRLNRNVTSIILESISDGVFTVDDRWRITSFNRAAEEITGVNRREAVGRRCADVFRASMCETDCALRLTLQTGKPVVNRSAFIIDSEGRRVPISVSTALLVDAQGRMVGGVETFRDLSLVEALRQKLDGRIQVGDLVSRRVAGKGMVVCDKIEAVVLILELQVLAHGAVIVAYVKLAGRLYARKYPQIGLPVSKTEKTG